MIRSVSIVLCLLAVMLASLIGPQVDAIPTSVLANSKALADNQKDKFFNSPSVGADGGFLGTGGGVVDVANDISPPTSSVDGQQQQQALRNNAPAAAAPPSPPPPPPPPQSQVIGDAVQVRPAPHKRAIAGPDMFKDTVANTRQRNWYQNDDGIWDDQRPLPGGRRFAAASLYPRMSSANFDDGGDNGDDDDDDNNNNNSNVEDDDEQQTTMDDTDLSLPAYLLPYGYRSAAGRQAAQLPSPTAYDSLQSLLNADMMRGANRDAQQQQQQQQQQALMMAADQLPDQYNPYYYYDGSVERRRRRKRRSAATSNKRSARDTPLSSAELLQLLALTEATQQQRHPTPISSGLSPYTEDLVMLIDPQQLAGQQQQQQRPYSTGYGNNNNAAFNGGDYYQPQGEWADGGPLDMPSVQYVNNGIGRPMSAANAPVYYQARAGVANVGRHLSARPAGIQY